MKLTSPPAIFLSLILLLQPLSALAFETDQYNLPPVPLVDVGDEVTEYVEAYLVKAIDKVNADIDKSQACINAKTKEKGCDSLEEETSKLVSMRSSTAVASEFARVLAGSDLMFTKFGKWMNSHKFRSEPSRYTASFGDSIFLALPTDYLTLSPTVKLYGNEFGVDKLEHFFQQGYKYFKMRNEAVVKGTTNDEAVKKAVKWGQLTERTYYGLMTSGVYSNADLVANYAGMKFYEGLSEPVELRGKLRPATIAIIGGRWKIADPDIRENLLKPFLTEHLNEALNPSGFAFNLYGAVRIAVRKHACPEWKALYPDLTAAALNEKSKALEIWNGEDYGHAEKGTKITVAETCFGK